MESILNKKVFLTIKNLILIILFAFMAFELDDIIIKVFLIPISIWLLYILIRALLEKSLDIKIDDKNQLMIDNILYDHDTYTYNINEFILGFKYIPFLTIEDKFEVKILKDNKVIKKFNASTFSKEDRDKLTYSGLINNKNK